MGNIVGHTHVFVASAPTQAELTNLYPERKVHFLGTFTVRGADQPQEVAVYWKGRKPSAETVTLKMVREGVVFPGINLP